MPLSHNKVRIKISKNVSKMCGKAQQKLFKTRTVIPQQKT